MGMQASATRLCQAAQKAGAAPGGNARPPPHQGYTLSKSCLSLKENRPAGFSHPLHLERGVHCGLGSDVQAWKADVEGGAEWEQGAGSSDRLQNPLLC